MRKLNRRQPSNGRKMKSLPLKRLIFNQQPSEIQPYPDPNPKSYLIVKSSTKLSVPVNVSINRAMSSFPCNAKRIMAIIFRSSWCHNINNMEKFNQSTVLSAIYDGQRKILLLRLNHSVSYVVKNHIWELVVIRFRKIALTDVKCKLCKAFIVSYFRYCSAVGTFSGLRIDTN